MDYVNDRYSIGAFMARYVPPGCFHSVVSLYGPQSRQGRDGEGKKNLPLPGIDYRSSSPGLVTTRLLTKVLLYQHYEA
jgi:hypothetical protein